MNLPDTNACITLLRGKCEPLIARWRATPVTEILLCSIVIYELRYGAERSLNPYEEHSKLDAFQAPYASIAFDAHCARTCGELRRDLERAGVVIGPYDLQIAAIALQHDLTLITHNTGEFSRVPGLKVEDWE